MERAIIAKKSQEVDEVASKMENSKSVISINYRGLTVTEFTELRSKLREAGCDCKVIKNNISRRAAKKIGIEDFANDFTGPTAVIFSGEDVVAPAKIANDFSKEHKALELKTGIIEGEFANIEKIKELASLPSYEGLLTMLAGGMMAPLRDLSIAMHLYTEENADA